MCFKHILFHIHKLENTYTKCMTKNGYNVFFLLAFLLT